MTTNQLQKLQSVKNIRIEIQDTAYRKQEIQERVATATNSKALAQLQAYIEDKYESLIQLEKEFHLLVNQIASTYVDRQILRLHYLSDMSFCKIEMWLFKNHEIMLSESAIKKRHQRFIGKLPGTNRSFTESS